MKAEIEKAIQALTKKAAEQKEAHHAMNFAQAALNLAHAFATMQGAPKG